MSPMISRTLRVLRGVPAPGSNDRSYMRVAMLRVIATHLRVERKAP